MNKIIMGLIVAVCVLGMALIMLNEKLGRKPDPAPVTAEAPSVPTSDGPVSAGLSSGRRPNSGKPPLRPPVAARCSAVWRQN